MIEYENILKRAFQEGINLIIGDSYSILATNSDDENLPTNIELIDELRNEFNLLNNPALNLQQIFTILESEKKKELYKYLIKKYKVTKYDIRYDVISSINIKTILTTNIDNLVHRIYGKSVKFYLNDVTIRGSAYNDKCAIDFIPLYGTVAYENEESHLLNVCSFDIERIRLFTDRLQSVPTPTLFWGKNLIDTNMIQMLFQNTFVGKTKSDKWIVLEKNDNSTIQYLKALGFYIITMDTTEMLEYLNKLIPLLKVEKKIVISNLFDKYSIPSPDKVPVRPILEFYLGAVPTWSDIFSDRVHKIERYTTIEDSIYAGYNTIVLGIPACGKTTLMMQLAYHIKFNGYKLVAESLSSDQADLILRNLNGEPAIIFLDNFSDDYQSVEKLLSSQKVTLVAFERYYNFDLVSHRINRQSCKIIDITDLSHKDIQAIYSKIPEKIRNSFLRKPPMTGDASPSLFEIVESNILRSSLKERFKSVLNDLKIKSQELHDLLLMCCYVHTCRTPVSFDMAYAFLRNFISDYKQVLKIINELGSLIAEYSEPYVDFDEQDYFLPRSVIISEAILNQASTDSLKRMLIQFHHEVSSVRIVRFDVFRRRAFDETLFGKAFEDWKEGEKFYQLLDNRDGSPYLKQQCALYLMHKKQFKKSFAWIDEALLQSSNRIPSIRNSHAIILFRANITSPDNNTSRETLKQSMQILSECYVYDKRKTYHALTYADHALQYWNFFNDETAKEFLYTSKKWLDEELTRSDWNRNVRRMRNKVYNILGLQII